MRIAEINPSIFRGESWKIRALAVAGGVHMPQLPKEMPGLARHFHLTSFSSIGVRRDSLRSDRGYQLAIPGSSSAATRKLVYLPT